MNVWKKVKSIKGPAFDSFLLAIIQIVTYATNIITTKVLSVELSLNAYGTYSTVNTVITIAASLTLFGLGDSMNYFYNRRTSDQDKVDREEYVNTIFLIQLIVGVIVGGILIVFSDEIAVYYNNPLVKSLIIIVCLKPWISNATHLYQVLFVSSGRAKLIAVRNLFVSMLKIGLIVLSIKIFNSLAAIFICLVFLDAVQLILFKVIFGSVRFKISVFSFNKKLIIPVIKYTIPMGVYFVTNTLMREIDKLVVGRFGTTEELAVYANCAKTLPLNILVTAFATVLVPYIMKSVSSKQYKLTIRIMRKYLSIGYLSVWMFSGALLLCAPEAIHFFYSSDYIVGLPIFIIYILDGMVQFASVHLVIAASGNAKFLMKLSIILLIVNAVISTVMYKIFGLLGFSTIGPAIATLLISIVYIGVLFRVSAKIMGVKVIDFLPIKKMAYYLLLLIVIGGATYFVRMVLEKMNVHWGLILFLVCGLYCLTILTLKLKEYKELFYNLNQLKRSDV